MEMSLSLLTGLLSPTPLLFSWFSWLKPSTARPRIRHDIHHFINLMAANHAAALLGRVALVPPEDLLRDQAFVEGGFGVNPTTIENRGGTPPAVVTRRAQRERACPEEEARRYLDQKEERKKALQEQRRKSREQHRERREREKRGRIAWENRRGVLAGVAGEEGDLGAADRAWARSRQAARMRGCAGCDRSRGGQQGEEENVWGAPRAAVPPSSAHVSRPSTVDNIEATSMWGEMPALGAKGA